MEDIKLHYGARSPTYCDKTSRFVRICLHLLAWWLKYEGPEAQERHSSVKGGSGPTEPSRHALKSLLFSYTEAGVSGPRCHPSLLSPWQLITRT